MNHQAIHFVCIIAEKRLHYNVFRHLRVGIGKRGETC